MDNFQQVQRQLTSHIRNPDVEAPPSGIEDRRLKIYRDLFYQNIEGFISGAFPVLRSIYAANEQDEQWHAMVRDFMVKHQCHTPYFLEISQEFLLYLQETREPTEQDLPFMLELAHYEWVELVLDVSDEDVKQVPADPNGDLLAAIPVVSPLAWSLAYQYPVHQIGKDLQPKQPSEQATYLVVYRNRDDEVKFMETNAVTARLLELLNAENNKSGLEILQQIAEEMQHPQPQQIIDGGVSLMNDLLATNIILGTR
jgi:hypothetical protein